MNELTNLTSMDTPKILMKNNVLIQAKYSLTLVENRIFLLMMYKLQKESEGVLSCEISHEEFKLVIKHAKDKTIKSISNSLSNLRKKSIFFMEEKENGKGNIWGEYGFLNGFTYDDERKIFKIEASQKIYDLLNTYLQTGYTPANLAVLFSMKNYYAQRLYDLLRLWSNTKNVINYSVNDLKMYLQLEDSYPEYGNFKRRVILPAVKELNSTGYFEVDFEEKKVGRKVDSIDFKVNDLDKRKYFVNTQIENSQQQKYDIFSDHMDLVLEVNDNLPQEAENIKDESKQRKPKVKKDKKYIPDENIFSKGTIHMINTHFKDIDFTKHMYLDAFRESVAITLERDNVDSIETKSYKYFKSTLENKIKYYETEYEKEKAHQEEMDLLW